jgi:hypothetical protein
MQPVQYWRKRFVSQTIWIHDADIGTATNANNQIAQYFKGFILF